MKMIGHEPINDIDRVIDVLEKATVEEELWYSYLLESIEETFGDDELDMFITLIIQREDNGCW